jgi:hypothetical protein
MFIFLRVLSLLPERTKPADFDSSSVVEKNPDANRWSNSWVRFVIIDRSIFFGHSCWAGKVILAVRNPLLRNPNERAKRKKEKSLQRATCHVSLHYSNGCQWIVLYSEIFEEMLRVSIRFDQLEIAAQVTISFETRNIFIDFLTLLFYIHY